MSDSISRRDWIKTVGAVSAGALVPADALLNAQSISDGAAVLPEPPPAAAASAIAHAPGEISALTSTSEVFVPPRGRGYMKFSFDFPEPSVAFDDFRFGFLVFTDENCYGLDRARLTAETTAQGIRLTCTGFVWAGGQERVPGTLTANLRRSGEFLEWDAVAQMDRPIKTITTIVRGIPRGQLSFGGGGFTDPRDNEVLTGYPFGAGDLHGPGAAGGMSTPVAVVQAGQNFVAISSLDDRVRPKRFYFQPGESAYRVEAIYEHDGWRKDNRVVLPPWRIVRASSMEQAIQPHFAHLERAYSIPAWETRTDVPAWMRRTAMATTLHGMHYTGYIFNDYARMLEILRWMAERIPGERVLVFIAAWDGRYYWDYPNYDVSPRMGGAPAFARLISEGRRLGFTMMPMFGANSANRKLALWPRIAGGATEKIDGDVYNLNWVDWNNDRHQDGWLSYMNLGDDRWRAWLSGRIASMIDRFGVDAYFLDIVGGHVNDAKADMHEGTRRLVADLRAKYPRVAAVGEMPYDALHGFIPMYHAGNGAAWRKYSRFFQHLSLPAPGRGSSGVHEAGWGRFDPQSLMIRDDAIPTLNIVDDTFTTHRDVMAEFITRVKTRAGIA